VYSVYTCIGDSTTKSQVFVITDILDRSQLLSACKVEAVEAAVQGLPAALQAVCRLLRFSHNSHTFRILSVKNIRTFAAIPVVGRVFLFSSSFNASFLFNPFCPKFENGDSD